MIRTPYQNQTKCYLSGRVSSMFEEVMLHALEKNILIVEWNAILDIRHT